MRERGAHERRHGRERNHHEHAREVLADEVGARIVAGRDRRPQRGAVEAELVEREAGRRQHGDQPSSVVDSGRAGPWLSDANSATAGTINAPMSGARRRGSRAK